MRRSRHLWGMAASGFALLFLAAPAVPRAAAPAADPLWEKAVAMAKQSEQARIVPGMMEMDSVIEKKDGSVDHRGTLVFKIVGFGADAEAQVVSATRDGKEVTEKARAEEERNRERAKREREKSGEVGDTVELSPSYHPFAPEAQDRVSASRLGPAELDGRSAVLFSFTQRLTRGRGVLVGKAWLDAETGEPLQVEASPDPLPKHVDRMLTRVCFELTPEGWWVPIRSEIQGEGGLLWIRRTFESRVRFWGFHQAPKEPSPANETSKVRPHP
ncbi:MAG: hypothetical protein WBS54_06105 [Acidobacteriota bacterium]